jgi:methyl coenzyme M reductase subunit C
MMGVGLALVGTMAHDIFDTEIVSIAMSPFSEFPRTPSNTICVVVKQMCYVLESPFVKELHTSYKKL